MKSKPQCKLCTYLIILIQYWFINCKKCTTQHRMLIGETEKGGEELVGIFCTFNFPLNLNLHWLIHLVVWQKPAQYCKGIILQLKKKRKKCKKQKTALKEVLIKKKKTKKKKNLRKEMRNLTSASYYCTSLGNLHNILKQLKYPKYYKR